MIKLVTRFLFILFSLLYLRVNAQSEPNTVRQDSTLPSIILKSGEAQIKALHLFSTQESLAELFLEVKLSDYKYYKSNTQRPVSIEVERKRDGKIEYIEIARFFLPWLKDGNSQTTGFRFNLSDYSSLFQGDVNLKFKGRNIEEDVALKLHFSWKKGRSALIQNKIENLWRSGIAGFDYNNKKRPINNKLKTQSIKIPNTSRYALLKIYLSGNCRGNKAVSEAEAGKFYFLKINGKSVAKRPIWRSDCGLNPHFPQEGPWANSRPNWCPGQALHVYDHFISLGSDSLLSISLQFQNPNENNPMIQNYIVSANLILFDSASFKNDAALLEILAPNKANQHKRYNPICSSPVIRVRNTGTDTLRSLMINYGLNDELDNRYRWRGELAFMEEEIVYLPPLNWYFHNQKESSDEFCVRLDKVNGLNDEYKGNNFLATELDLAPIYPKKIGFQFYSPKNAEDEILELVDDMGMPLFEASNFVSDSLYNYQIDLAPGCYEFVAYDLKGNGLPVSNKKNKKASLKIISSENKVILKDFEPNFGGEIRQQFMILK
jgi:hypothetical protein